MNISLFLHQYLDFRLSMTNHVELYLIDQVQDSLFEIIIKDNADPMKEEVLEQANTKISSLQIQTPHKYYQYFHKGMNNLQIELKLGQLDIDLKDLNTIIGLLMIDHIEKDFVFTYLSPKGEYLLSNDQFKKNFEKNEFETREFSQHLVELLRGHLEDVMCL